jgi:hypothetical protein
MVEQSSYVIAAIQSRPTPLPSANVVTLCVCVCVGCKGGGEPIFLRGTFDYAPARLAQNSLGNWAERLLAGLVCVQTPEMVNRIFFFPIAELSRIIIIIIT